MRSSIRSYTLQALPQVEQGGPGGFSSRSIPWLSPPRFSGQGADHWRGGPVSVDRARPPQSPCRIAIPVTPSTSATAHGAPARSSDRGTSAAAAQPIRAFRHQDRLTAHQRPQMADRVLRNAGNNPAGVRNCATTESHWQSSASVLRPGTRLQLPRIGQGITSIPPTPSSTSNNGIQYTPVLIQRHRCHPQLLEPGGDFQQVRIVDGPEQRAFPCRRRESARTRSDSRFPHQCLATSGWIFGNPCAAGLALAFALLNVLPVSSLLHLFEGWERNSPLGDLWILSSRG